MSTITETVVLVTDPVLCVKMSPYLLVWHSILSVFFMLVLCNKEFVRI